MLPSAGGDSGPWLVFLHPLVLHVLAWHSSAQQCPVRPARLQLLLWWDLRETGTAALLGRVDLNVFTLHGSSTQRELLSLGSGSHTAGAAGHRRAHNCLYRALCCPLLRSLLQMWTACKVIGFHYLIHKVGVGGRVREDKLK